MRVPSVFSILMLPPCLWAPLGEAMSTEHREGAAAQEVCLAVTT